MDVRNQEEEKNMQQLWKGLSSPLYTTWIGRRFIQKKISNHTADWVFRQVNDKYIKLAEQGNYRSRAAFKLKQIDNKHSLLKKNQVVVELGCHPGGWSQVIIERCLPMSSNSFILGVDKHRVDTLIGHTFLQGEVGSEKTLQNILIELGERKADVVLSDMAPPLIGIKQDDHLLSSELAITAAEVAEKILKRNGSFVVKMFMGNLQSKVKVYLSSLFESVSATKPHSSRSDSPEIFFVCKGFKGRSALAEEVHTRTAFPYRDKEGRETETPVLLAPQSNKLNENNKFKNIRR